jgi:hypothetical protein
MACARKRTSGTAAENGKRTGNNQRRIFAQTMTRDNRRFQPGFLFPHTINRVRGRQHDGLRVRGETQFFDRTVGNQLAQILAERIGCLLHGFAHHGVVGECIEHADRLGTLSRKNEREFHEVLARLDCRMTDVARWRTGESGRLSALAISAQ